MVHGRNRRFGSIARLRWRRGSLAFPAQASLWPKSNAPR
jgi:hypothetical protein